MIELTLCRLLSLYPRGVSNSQLLWRLKSAGTRHSPEDLLQALVALADRGEIRCDAGSRWHLVRPDAGTSPRDGAGEGASGPALVALQLQRSEAVPAPAAVVAESASLGTLPDPAPLLAYYAATQRRDPRGRITLFADQHGQSWQLVAAQGRWWAGSRLGTRSLLLPATLREALSRRGASGAAALGWPLMVVNAREGETILPVLTVPVEWRLDGEEFLVETASLRPSINPDWMRAIRRTSGWTETALTERLFPEGEAWDLAAVSDRLRHALATLGGGALKPAAPARALDREAGALHNAMALAFPGDATFTQGTAADLEAMAKWSPDVLAQTALAALWHAAPGPVATPPSPLAAPAPLTDRQLEAAESALDAPLTVIQGPPGTGKSQVILSLMLSCILAGRTVLFASRNHQALDEVESRLREALPGTPLPVRGRDADGTQDTSFLRTLEALAQWETTSEPHAPATAQALHRTLAGLAADRIARRETDLRHAELCGLVEELESLRTAWESPQDFERALRPAGPWQWLRSVLRREAPTDGQGPAALSRRIAHLQAELKGGAQPPEMPEAPEGEALLSPLRDLARHVTTVAAPDRPGLVERVEELAFGQVRRVGGMGAFEAGLVTKYRPVWAISTLSVPSRVPLVPGLFDLVIFDEASQCDIASALPLMARAKRAVVVGDPAQLRFVPGLGNSTEHALMDAAGLPVAGRSAVAQSINSLFDFVARRPGARRHFLKDQFRSAPPIVDYLGSEFYAGKGLEGHRGAEAFAAPLGYRAGLSWLDVRGRVTREDGGNVNLAEVAAILDTLRRLARDPDFSGSVGVLSPFNAQIGRVQQAVQSGIDAADRARLQLKIATIDKFQGGEADVILFSLVAADRGPALGFLQKEARRLNVAVSRARALCLVIGDLDFARNCGVGPIERLAQRATSPFSPPRLPFDSIWERRLDAAMRARGLKPFPQYPVGTRYLDFALDPDGVKLDVEVDGRQWHTDADGNRKVADRLRDRELRARGWKVRRFWVHQLSQDMEGCLDCIERELARR